MDPSRPCDPKGCGCQRDDVAMWQNHRKSPNPARVARGFVLHSTYRGQQLPIKQHCSKPTLRASLQLMHHAPVSTRGKVRHTRSQAQHLMSGLRRSCNVLYHRIGYSWQLQKSRAQARTSRMDCCIDHENGLDEQQRCHHFKEAPAMRVSWCRTFSHPKVESCIGHHYPAISCRTRGVGHSHPKLECCNHCIVHCM